MSKEWKQSGSKLSNAEIHVSGTRRSVARWQYCMLAVNEWFGMTVGAMFVKDNFPEESRDDVINVFLINSLI